MLLQLSTTLEELIVKYLAATPWVGAAWLQQAIARDYKPYTRRGVYKELSKLEREGIVVKVKNSYSLRLAWVMNLVSFVGDMYDVYLDPSLLKTLLLKGGEKITWRFSSLAKMDMAWTQLMLGMHRACPGKAMCVWCPHQWFDFSHGERNRQFIKANDIAANRRFHIIGGSTYLDRLGGAGQPKIGVYSYAEGPFEDLRNTYYTLIGDYVICVKLDTVTTRKIEELFSRVKTARDINPQEMGQIFGARVNAKLTLEINPRRAAELKRKFARFFGLKIEEIG